MKVKTKIIKEKKLTKTNNFLHSQNYVINDKVKNKRFINYKSNLLIDYIGNIPQF
jgi:hypothetical protein